MPLTLTITSYQKLTPGVEAVRTLAEGSLSIGRAPGNDWMLPDPELVISGRHCLIQAHGGDYYVTDTSTNGVFIGGRRLGRGNSQQLRQGDVLTLGDYELRVDLAAAAAPAPVHDPFADLGKPAAGADPFAGLGTPTPAADPFASFGTPAADPLAGLAPGGADPFADLLGPLHGPAGSDDVLGLGKPAGAGQDFGLFDVPRKPAPGPATPADHLPSEQQAFVPPAPVIPDDWDDLLGPVATPAPTPSEPTPTPTPATEPEPAAPAPVADHPFADLGPKPEAAEERAEEAFAALPEIELPSTPFSDVTPTPTPPVAEVRTPTPTPVPPAVSPAAPRVAPAAPAGSGGGTAAVDAFLAGAGLSHLQLGSEQQEALMHALGLSYRLMVQGLIDVLRARASLKGEFRLSQTTIRPIENNPLKFAPNVEEAMALLLTHRSNVYLPPERAIAEAFQDLKVHQMAMMAGMQAALALLLKRFDPAALEARLGESGGGGIGGLLGGGRKARNWEQFTQLYQEIAREAEDDFQDLFGREFARAYEEQIARLGRR